MIARRQDAEHDARMSDWQEQAVCASADPELWYPEPGPGSMRDEYQAAVICSGCPVRVQCLQAALARGEEFGVWGGMNPRERRRLRRKAA